MALENENWHYPQKETMALENENWHYPQNEIIAFENEHWHYPQKGGLHGRSGYPNLGQSLSQCIMSGL